jgi:hypothetical protein
MGILLMGSVDEVGCSCLDVLLSLKHAGTCNNLVLSNDHFRNQFLIVILNEVSYCPQ